jgi:DNA polymerase I-like protein with 3'-5' exonuclease and polymerase domains
MENIMERQNEDALSLAETLSAIFQCPVKDTSQEFLLLKKLLGEQTATAYYWGYTSAKEKVTQTIEDMLCKMTSKDRVCYERDLLTSQNLKRTEKCGIPINREALLEACKEVQQEYKEAYEALRQNCCSLQFTLSPEFVRGRAKIPSADELLNEELSKVRKMWKHTFLMNAEKLLHSIKTDAYGNSRIYCGFENNAAVSGRIQTHKPNVQGFSKKVREKCFNTPPGQVLVYDDYISEELVLMAVLAEDTKLLTDIVRGVDLHTNLAAKLFHCLTSGITEAQRTLAKRLTFATLYGAGESTLEACAKDHGFNLPGIFIKQTVRGAYPAIGALEREVKRTQTLKMIDGNTIPCANIKKPHTYVNRMIQGSGSIVLKDVYNRLMDELDGVAQTVCLVHDEVILTTSVSLQNVCTTRVNDIMTKVLSNYGIDIEMPVEITIKGGNVS